MKKVTLSTFILISLLFAHTVIAQTKTRAVSVPKSVMEAEFKTVDGSAPIRLANYTGEVAVLLLWASWCAPCRAAVAGLNDINKEFSSRGVEVIGLTLEDPESGADSVSEFMQNSKVDYKMGWINKEMTTALLSLPDAGQAHSDQSGSIPQILVINSEDLMIKRFIGYSSERTPAKLRETIERELNNPTTK